MTNQKQLQTYLYSTVGIVIMFVVVVAINVIANVAKKVARKSNQQRTSAENR